MDWSEIMSRRGANAFDDPRVDGLALFVSCSGMG